MALELHAATVLVDDPFLLIDLLVFQPSMVLPYIFWLLAFLFSCQA